MSQFQLFPSPSTTKASKNPFRLENQRTAGTHPMGSIPLNDLNGKDIRTEALLFQIVDDAKSIKPAKKTKTPRSTPVSVPETVQELRTPESLFSKSPKNGTTNQWGSPAYKVSQASPTGSGKIHIATQLAQGTSEASSSPVIPMRSIFPQYNPDVSLSQQQYYPQLSANTRKHRPKELSFTPPPEIDRALGPKTVPASVMNFPAGVLDQVEIQYSSITELRSLWEAANGQRPQDLAGTFNLRVARTEAETYTFGDPQAPFYKMQTYSTNELSVTRTNPSKPNSSIPIMMLKLEDRRREPPNDGLVSILFSRLAAMLAIDEAEAFARKHHLGPSEAAEAEGKALKRAAAQESCRLSWNNAKHLYELHHPSLTKLPPPALVGAAGIPLSPVRSKYSGLLHISVSTPSKESNSRQPPTILVTTPMSANAVEGANMAATPRTSTLPLADSDELLASLDLGTLTLSISAAAITATIPSLYAIDSLVTAMLAVAVSDEASNTVLTDMELYDPTKEALSKHSSLNSNIKSLAEQEDAKEGIQLLSKIKFANPQSTDSTQRKWFHFWRPQKPTKPKTKKIVVEEFDLEKYGRYGYGSSREGQKLPGLTRGCLRILFWGLDILVRILTMMVKIIAWLLVNLTRCTTSAKA
ncbi:conserved proline-rich protein [Aspergillus flavus]|nr:conserved proline-rich protein [Aspergillus flavus]